MRNEKWIVLNGNYLDNVPEELEEVLGSFEHEISKTDKLNESYLSLYEKNDSYFIVIDCRIIVRYNAEDMSDVEQKADNFKQSVRNSNLFNIHSVEDVKHNGFIKVNIETGIEANSNLENKLEEFSKLYNPLDK
jgi:hypothetical protein